MSRPDLNLLLTLDVLLAEGSVARGKAVAAQPVGYEPGAGAIAQHNGRSAPGHTPEQLFRTVLLNEPGLLWKSSSRPFLPGLTQVVGPCVCHQAFSSVTRELMRGKQHMADVDAGGRLGELGAPAPRIGDGAMATIAAEREAARAKTAAIRAQRLASAPAGRPRVLNASA